MSVPALPCWREIKTIATERAPFRVVTRPRIHLPRFTIPPPSLPGAFSALRACPRRATRGTGMHIAVSALSAPRRKGNIDLRLLRARKPGRGFQSGMNPCDEGRRGGKEGSRLVPQQVRSRSRKRTRRRAASAGISRAVKFVPLQHTSVCIAKRRD